MKGYRTLAINAGIVAGTALLGWAAGVDWSQYVSPTVAVVITGVVNIGMRFVTTSPVGQSGSN